MKVYYCLCLLVFIFSSNKTYAEWCHMSGGCTGEFGYIFVPISQIDSAPPSPDYSYSWFGTVSKVNSAIRYPIDTSDRLFKELGLPAVNSVVTLNKPYDVMLIDNIHSDHNVAEYQKDPYFFDDGLARIYHHQFDGTHKLISGSKLLILSYQDFANVKGKSFRTKGVFAFIRIIHVGD